MRGGGYDTYGRKETCCMIQVGNPKEGFGVQGRIIIIIIIIIINTL
jgi:hypothetical protein